MKRRNRTNMYSRNKQKVERRKNHILKIKKENLQYDTKKENSNLNAKKEEI